MRITTQLGWLAAAALLASAGLTAPPANDRHAHDAVALLEEAFNQQDVAGAFNRYVAPGYIQHNPSAPTGRAAAIAVLSKFVAAAGVRYEIKHVISQGDLVAVHSHVTTKGDPRGAAVVDMFRFAPDGKIAEHWDVGQAVPEKSMNDNGMF